MKINYSWSYPLRDRNVSSYTSLPRFTLKDIPRVFKDLKNGFKQGATKFEVRIEL